MTQPASNFTVVNDRVVFDNGITKRWRCPVCAWWREWQVESVRRAELTETPARPSLLCLGRDRYGLSGSSVARFRRRRIAILPRPFLTARVITKYNRRNAVGCTYAIDTGDVSGAGVR